MQRLFIPSLGPTDWRRLLADPTKQWVRGKSALEMAVCWEAARTGERGLPLEVATALDSAVFTLGAELLIGVPEHQVSFDGGGHASQNDLWALLRCERGLISMTVEAKAGEELGKVVGDWLPSDGERSGKLVRLADLQRRLAIVAGDLAPIRYQLLHRTASALKEAERFNAQAAVMLIQSFNREADEQSWKDFKQFGVLMGATVTEGCLSRSNRTTGIPLFMGWVTSMPADLGLLEAAV